MSPSGSAPTACPSNIDLGYEASLAANEVPVYFWLDSDQRSDFYGFCATQPPAQTKIMSPSLPLPTLQERPGAQEESWLDTLSETGSPGSSTILSDSNGINANVEAPEHAYTYSTQNYMPSTLAYEAPIANDKPWQREPHHSRCAPAPQPSFPNIATQPVPRTSPPQMYFNHSQHQQMLASLADLPGFKPCSFPSPWTPDTHHDAAPSIPADGASSWPSTPPPSPTPMQRTVWWADGRLDGTGEVLGGYPAARPPVGVRWGTREGVNAVSVTKR